MVYNKYALMEVYNDNIGNDKKIVQENEYQHFRIGAKNWPVTTEL